MDEKKKKKSHGNFPICYLVIALFVKLQWTPKKNWVAKYQPSIKTPTQFLSHEIIHRRGMSM